MRVVPVELFGRQCDQVLEVAKVLCELTGLAGLESQAALLRRVQAELAEIAQSDGSLCLGRAEELRGSSEPTERASLRDLAWTVQRLEAASAAARSEDERLSSALQALCGEVEQIAGEARLARKDAHAARAEAGEARAAAEAQEVRMRVVTTDVQNLRNHVADSLKRSEEDLEACRSRSAKEVTEIRSVTRDLAAESRSLRQSIASHENVELQRPLEGSCETAVEAALQRLEKAAAQKFAEVSAAGERWQGQAETWKKGIVQGNNEAIAALENDLSKMQRRLEKVASERKVGEWAHTTAHAAETSAVGAVSCSTGTMSPKSMWREAAPAPASASSLQGLEDMPRPWRAALEDAVRRVQWVSEETRRELLKRTAEHQLLVEGLFATAGAEQAQQFDQARAACDEAIRRSDEAASAAKCAQEVAQEGGEVASRKAAGAASVMAAELRAEIKAATSDLGQRLEDVVHTQHLRFTSLDEACAGLERAAAKFDGTAKRNEEAVCTLDVRLREVAEIAQRNSRSVECQADALKGFCNPFQHEVDRRFQEVWEESAAVRALVGQHESKASDEVWAARAVTQTRCEELRSSLDQLSIRVDREVVESNDRASKNEALKRRLEEEVRAAVDARCLEIGDFAQKLRDTLLSEVRVALSGSSPLASKVTEMGAALEFVQGESTARGEQLQVALAAAERLATAAQGDACEALQKARHTESLLTALLRPGVDIGSTSGDPREVSGTLPLPSANFSIRPPDPRTLQKACGAGFAIPSAGGSGVGAVKQLRAQTPRRPQSAGVSRDAAQSES